MGGCVLRPINVILLFALISGLSALNGHVVSGDVYAWAAVLILPINSALNPFLYTFSAIIGQKVRTPTSTCSWKKEDCVI